MLHQLKSAAFFIGGQTDGFFYCFVALHFNPDFIRAVAFEIQACGVDVVVPICVPFTSNTFTSAATESPSPL
jgi:hypothetical protein